MYYHLFKSGIPLGMGLTISTKCGLLLQIHGTMIKGNNFIDGDELLLHGTRPLLKEKDAGGVMGSEKFLRTKFVTFITEKSRYQVCNSLIP